MIVQQENLSTIAINEAGLWQLRSSWLLQPRKIPASQVSLQEWYSAVRSWLPRPGDPWREASDSRQGYAVNTQWIVSEASAEELKGVSTRTFRITIIANPGENIHIERRNKTVETFTDKGEHLRSASWLISENVMEEWLPEVGSELQWQGGNFLCRHIELKEVSPFLWNVEISAVNMDIEPPAEIAFRRNHDFETEKYGTWRVRENALEAFKAANDINSPAPWAGDSFKITDMEITPSVAGICSVSLTARDINVRLIGVTRNERFIGFTEKKKVRRKITWKSQWRVHKNSLRRFANITGKSARSWTGSNSVVISSDSKRLSDYEFEYILQAVPRKNSMYEIDNDDKSDLSGRIDISAEIVEMILPPEQCGWWRNAYGVLEEIPDWNPAVECPFATEAPLPKNLVEVPLKTLQVVETRYFRDKNFTLIPRIDHWMAGGRVWYGMIDKQVALWLKEEIYNDIVTDDSGDTWRKVSCVFRLPPVGFQWNKTYWNQELPQ